MASESSAADKTEVREQTAAHVAVQVQDGKAASNDHSLHQAAPKFPWKLSHTERLKAFFMCMEFRAAVQLTVGQLIVLLFVFINKLAFPNGCLSSIFYVAAAVLVAQDAHVGSKMNAAAFVIGPLWFGSVLAGCVVTIARACQVAFTGLLCLFTIVGLLPVCLLRATMGPGVGIFSNLGFGITILQGQFAWAPSHGYQLLWQNAVGHTLMDGLVAALGVAVSGLIALPILASHALRMEAAEVLMKVGHSMSGYATHMFEQSSLPQAAEKGAAQVVHTSSDGGGPREMASPGLSRHDSKLTAIMDDQPDEDYWNMMQEATDPAGFHTPRHLCCPQSISIGALRPKLAHCQALAGQAEREPPFMGRHRVLLSKWRPVLASLEALITKVAALESLLEGRGESLLHDGRLQELLGYDVLPVMRLLHAHMAAACAHLAKLLRAHRGHQKYHYQTLFGPSWSALEHELAHTLHITLQGYWVRWVATHQAGFSLPSPQVRALLYTSTLTNAIMEAMAAVETAVLEALAHQTTLYPRPPGPPPTQDRHQQLARASQPVHDALALSGFSGKVWVQDPLSQGEIQSTGGLPRVPSGAVLPDEGQGQFNALGDGQGNAGRPVNGQADSQILADGQADRQTDADRPADGQTDRQLQPVNGQTERQPEPTAPRRKSLGDLTKSARRLLPVSFRQRPLQQQYQGQTEGQPDGQSTRQPSGQPSRQADGQTNGQSSMPVNGPSRERCSPGSTAGPTLKVWLWNEVAWIEPLLRTLLAQMCFQNVWLTLTKTVPATCKSRQLLRDTLWHGRKFQFFCKYYLAMSGSLCGCLILSQDVPVIRQWSPLYVMITVIVVMSEKVDTTITKGSLRLLGTGVGGVLGYLVMLNTGLATSPVGLAAIICSYTWLLGLVSMTQFKYAVFLTLITADAVILCQYSPLPGAHGEARYFYARCASIAVGVVVVLLIGLILPWFTYTDALDSLGEAYKEATQLMLKFYILFHDDVKSSDSGGSSPKDQAASVAGLLEQKIAAPLVRVQTALAKETVLWKRGVLVMPQIVGQTVQALRVLLDRLSALQMMLLQKPVVSGHYTSAPYHSLLQPIDKDLRRVLDSMARLGDLTAQLLSESCSGESLRAVQEGIAQLEQHRVALRRNYIRTSHLYHLEVKSKSGKARIKNRTVDDAVRYLSWLFAASNAVDKATLLAKLVCSSCWIQTRCHNKPKANMAGLVTLSVASEHGIPGAVSQAVVAVTVLVYVPALHACLEFSDGVWPESRASQFSKLCSVSQ